MCVRGWACHPVAYGEQIPRLLPTLAASSKPSLGTQGLACIPARTLAASFCELPSRWPLPLLRGSSVPKDKHW